MFQKQGQTVTIGFLVAVDIIEGGKATPDKVKAGLADGIWHQEDVGNIDITYLGEIEVVDPTTEQETA